MQRMINLARGVARIEVVCMYPERFLNVCSMNGIAFWDLERDGGVIRAYMRESGFRALRELSVKYGFEVTRIEKSGAPYFVRRLKKRYILLAFTALVMLSLRVMALFVWDIRIYGNEDVSDKRIMEMLAELDFAPGTLGVGISSERIANEMLMRIPELSWLAVNIRGSRADVLVRERIPKPEILDEKSPVVIFAAKSGIITKMSVMEGTANAAVGDTVKAGDLLVSGSVTDIRGAARTVRALADIEARTWYSLEACMPLVSYEKQYTGGNRVKNSVFFAGNVLKLNISSGVTWSNYDKITTEKNFTLPGGVVLPVKIVSDRYAEYELAEIRIPEPEAESTLTRGLIERLVRSINGGVISSMEFETRVENGVMYTVLHAECIEQIAAERVYVPETAPER